MEMDINTDEVKYSQAELDFLTGGEPLGKNGESILLLARALKDPLRLPWLLKEFCQLKLGDEVREDFRLALIRIQIESEMRMHEDIQRFQQRRYVAQVIEILLFQDLLLAPREGVEEESEY